MGSHSKQRSFKSIAPGLLLGVVSLVTLGHVGDIVQSATLTVASDGSAGYTTIQAAIDDAVPGDEIFVRCGIYQENIVMRSGIDLRGAGARCTVIDGGDDGDVVTLPTVQEPTHVEGFTIRNGRQKIGALGAGIASFGGQPVITRNIIESNGDGSSGFGIFFQGFTEQLDSPTITGNVIRDNEGCCAGGGIALNSPEGAIVTSNLIVGNAAYYGGGMYVYGGASTIAHNTVVNNDAWLGGGLALLTTGPETKLVNNTIVGNVAVIYAGGVWGGPDPESTFSNNAFDNIPDNWWIGDQTGINGNISEDPRFSDTRPSFQGFHPRSDSPLVDAGASGFGGPFDLRGIPRPLDGNADGVTTADIGARENEGITMVLHDASSWSWNRTIAGAQTFNVYRGDLDLLRDGGSYIQDPELVPEAEHFCDIPLGLEDNDQPDTGRGFFYLVSVRNLVVGTLGFDSSLVERTQGPACAGTDLANPRDASN